LFELDGGRKPTRRYFYYFSRKVFEFQEEEEEDRGTKQEKKIVRGNGSLKEWKTMKVTPLPRAYHEKLRLDELDRHRDDIVGSRSGSHPNCEVELDEFRFQ
jgi:hypothetical protein